MFVTVKDDSATVEWHSEKELSNWFQEKGVFGNPNALKNKQQGGW
jgi:hypothetical protein